MSLQSDRRKDITDREVIELFNKGLNYRQIAKYYHTESKIIINRLIRNGIQVSKLSSLHRQDLKDPEIVKLYSEGKSANEIAVLLNTTDVTICNRLKSNGIILKQNFRADIKDEELINLYVDKKLSTPKIAKKLDTTAQLVKTRLKNAGITLRTKIEAGELIAKKNECVICGTIFRPRQHSTDTNSLKRKTCCKACRSALLSQLHSGKNSTNWKDGSSQMHYQKVLRETHVMICEICQTEEVRIDTHHEDRDHTNNTKENLHPWCVTCHAKYHYITDGFRLKGWNPNTPKLSEFKKRLDELGISYKVTLLSPV
jgi:hypothetical protein